MRTRHPAFWRYTAFQVPGWILAAIGGYWIHRWFEVPLWLASGVLVAWVIKDYALYPFLRLAYETDPRSPIERLVGTHAETIAPLEPDGYIRVRGELWRARADPPDAPIPKGQMAEVCGTEGMTLLVKPARE